MEKRYTKEEIITLYFNKFDFLYNANGIEMASKVYFNKKNQRTLLFPKRYICSDAGKPSEKQSAQKLGKSDREEKCSSETNARNKNT